MCLCLTPLLSCFLRSFVAAGEKVMSAREKNLLTFAQHTNADIHGVDVSQGISRFPKAGCLLGRHFLPALTTSSKIYLFCRKRLLCGNEALRAQGFPTEEFEDPMLSTHPRVLHDLAGNAMSATVVYATFSAMLLSIPWTEPEQHFAAEDIDMDSAIGAFASSVAPVGGGSDSD